MAPRMTYIEYQITREQMLAKYQDRLEALIAERDRELHALHEQFRHGERRQTNAVTRALSVGILLLLLMTQGCGVWNILRGIGQFSDTIPPPTQEDTNK